MPRLVRGGLIQASVGEETSAPLDHLKKLLIDKHVALIEEAARRGVQVLCLQELFYGPYFPAEQNPRWYAMVEFGVSSYGMSWMTARPFGLKKAAGTLAAWLHILFASSGIRS